MGTIDRKQGVLGMRWRVQGHTGTWGGIGKNTRGHHRSTCPLGEAGSRSGQQILFARQGWHDRACHMSEASAKIINDPEDYSCVDTIICLKNLQGLYSITYCWCGVAAVIDRCLVREHSFYLCRGPVKSMFNVAKRSPFDVNKITILITCKRPKHWQQKLCTVDRFQWNPT